MSRISDTTRRLLGRELIDKDDDGDDVLRGDIADRLREPAKKEAEMLESFAKSGASEADLAAVAGATRLLESVGATVNVNAPVRKAEDPLRLKTPEERERIAEDARKTNERIQKHAREAAAAKIEKERLANRTPAERTDDLVDATKALEIRADRHAEKLIEQAAERIRKADRSLTKEQAYVKALRDDPELYAWYQRHQLRQSGWLDDSPSTLRKARDQQERIDAAVAAVRKSDPELTQLEALQKALKNDPSLH